MITAEDLSEEAPSGKEVVGFRLASWGEVMGVCAAGRYDVFFVFLFLFLRYIDGLSFKARFSIVFGNFHHFHGSMFSSWLDPGEPVA